jgi:site-specific DNA-cytosine methylase
MQTVMLDLFSGIGGLVLAAKYANLKFDAHYYSEVEYGG